MITRYFRRSASRGATLAVCGLLACGLASEARAESTGITISPLTVVLDAHQSASSVDVVNGNDAPLRMQITPHAWDQDATGAIVLTATKAIVAFPQLVTVAPHARQRIRLAALVAPAEREQTFRLVIAELPAFGAQAANSASITFRARYSIPVRIEPRREIAATRFGDASLTGNVLRVAVVNDGNVLARMSGGSVTALGAGEARVFRAELPDAVILAGETRTFEIPVPRGTCAKIAALDQSATVEGKPLARTTAVDAGCAR